MAMKASDPLSLSRSWFIISKYMRASILTPQAIASDVGRDSFARRFLLKSTLVETWVSNRVMLQAKRSAEQCQASELQHHKLRQGR